MTDIAKCADFRCPARANCWRFTAPAASEQTFADFGRRRGREDKCMDYWPITDQQKRAKRQPLSGERLR